MAKQKTDLNIAYIGGGSAMWARTFMSDLALEPQISGEMRLYDIDVNAAKANEIIGNRLTANPEYPGKWRYVTVPTLQEALTGADFVIISILPGDMEHMRTDVHMPERLGVYQSVGDTAGPGGIMRTLRTIPMYVEFAEAIREYSPDAWVINYTNPMCLCVRALYHIFPHIKAFGCCHEVFCTQDLLAAMVKNEFLEDAKRSEIIVDVIGINHFTWFYNASYKETDLMRVFSKYAETYYEDGFSSNFEYNLHEYFTSKNRVKFDLQRRYKWIAAAGDRHLAEFMPGDMYLKDPETVKYWKFHLTPVDWRIADRKSRLEQTARLVAGEEQLNPKASGEEGLLLIKALCGLGDVVSNVNLPNTAQQVDDLPIETVVETNALFSLDSVKPKAAGSLTDEIYDLLLPHVQNQQVVLNAALGCDREAVYSAFRRDPLLCGRFDKRDIHALADDMIKSYAGILPDGWR